MFVDVDMYFIDVINILWFVFFILYVYIWFYGIYGFCIIRMINIECMWVMMLFYKFNIGCVFCNFKGIEIYFEFKKFKFYFFLFLM